MNPLKLNPQQRKALVLLCEKGYSNPQIAEEICKSRKTVEKIMEVLFDVYNVSSRQKLIIEYWKQKTGVAC